MERADAVQPGGRRPAPGELALVQAFVNTHYDLAGERGGEILRDPDALVRWLSTRCLIGDDARLDDADLRRALTVREGLRAWAAANNQRPLDREAIEAMRCAAEPATIAVRLELGGPHFAPAPGTGLDGALGALSAAAARAMIDGTWQRLKACPGRDCGWVFYDHSKNLSARWCAMKVCGDREKARTYYARHRDATEHEP